MSDTLSRPCPSSSPPVGDLVWPGSRLLTGRCVRRLSGVWSADCGLAHRSHARVAAVANRSLPEPAAATQRLVGRADRFVSPQPVRRAEGPIAVQENAAAQLQNLPRRPARHLDWPLDDPGRDRRTAHPDRSGVWRSRRPRVLRRPHRFSPLPLTLSQLPHIDAVVVSHDHYDHLDHRTLIAMADWDTTFIVPSGSARTSACGAFPIHASSNSTGGRARASALCKSSPRRLAMPRGACSSTTIAKAVGRLRLHRSAAPRLLLRRHRAIPRHARHRGPTWAL